MKKIFRTYTTTKILLYATFFAILVSMSGCGNDKNNAEKTSVSASANATAKPRFQSVADFAASEDVQNQLAALSEGLQENGVSLTITGEGDTLIYTYTYSTLVKENGMAETLESGLNEQTDTFQNIASSIRKNVNVADPHVIVKYVDSTGTEIYSREFISNEAEALASVSKSATGESLSK